MLPTISEISPSGVLVYKARCFLILSPSPEQFETADSTQARKQNAARIEALYSEHNRALVLFLTRKLKDPQEAKEVAQEAYVRMLQLDAPGGISYLRAFLFKTASNLAFNRLRDAARRGRIDDIELFDDNNSSPSPECGVAADQQLQRVLRVMDELPAKCRYAFIMNRWVGHDITEVARLMNLSERMVRMYVERALVFCQKRMIETGGRDE
jgi:RNA polymerase sigma factor (sigma-70 family)